MINFGGKEKSPFPLTLKLYLNQGLKDRRQQLFQGEISFQATEATSVKVFGVFKQNRIR